jgi:hypothetical protein
VEPRRYIHERLHVLNAQQGVLNSDTDEFAGVVD